MLRFFRRRRHGKIRGTAAASGLRPAASDGPPPDICTAAGVFEGAAQHRGAVMPAKPVSPPRTVAETRLSPTGMLEQGAVSPAPAGAIAVTGRMTPAAGRGDPRARPFITRGGRRASRLERAVGARHLVEHASFSHCDACWNVGLCRRRQPATQPCTGGITPCGRSPAAAPRAVRR